MTSTIRTIPTNRWTGFGGVVLLVVGVGIVLRHPGLLVAAAIGVGYLAAATAGSPPSPSLRIERTVDAADPDPGDPVTITVAATNEGDSTLFDLRLVDAVPSGLEVIDGSPRCATALSGGDSVRFSYTVSATRGRHEWTDVEVVTRDVAGSTERSTTFDVRSELRCVPPLDGATELPLRGLTSRLTGRVPTDVGGTGVEFHSVREYRRGDPLRRVDWNRTARTGELATLQLREERGATVVLVVDSRERAYLASGPDVENAVERGVDAAGRTFVGLLDSGDRVGLVGLSGETTWLSPGSGSGHRARAQELLATDPAFAPTPSGAEDRVFLDRWVRRFRSRLPPDAQVLFFSPLPDEGIVRTIRRLDAYGHLVTVVSPDPTARETPERTLAWIERRLRIRTLRADGVRVVNWRDEPLPVAIARTETRRSR